jgi:uncharacterized protein (DUF1778 family)
MHDTSTPARKTAFFIMRIAPEDRAVIEKAASAKGVSVSSYFRSKTLAAAMSEGAREAA